MDRAHYNEAKLRLKEITERLRCDDLSASDRESLEKEGKTLTKIVMNPWIPFDWTYRIVMMAIAAIGCWGLIRGHYLLVLIWLLLFIFSPRVIGQVLMRIAGIKDS